MKHKSHGAKKLFSDTMVVNIDTTHLSKPREPYGAMDNMGTHAIVYWEQIVDYDRKKDAGPCGESHAMGSPLALYSHNGMITVCVRDGRFVLLDTSHQVTNTPTRIVTYQFRHQRDTHLDSNQTVLSVSS